MRERRREEGGEERREEGGEERRRRKQAKCSTSPKGLMSGAFSDLQLQPGGGLVASAI